MQYLHESGDRQGPDYFVGNFLPWFQKWRLKWLSRAQLDLFRSDAFYYYLIARTRYYDKVFRDAISNNVKLIVNIGCGMDTRSYRFRKLLEQSRASVLECDQEMAIISRRRLADQFRPPKRVALASIDLNQGLQPELGQLLLSAADSKVLVMMEGVSPYIEGSAFGRFLVMLSEQLSDGSVVAYDWKLSGVDDEFGQDGRSHALFRLSEQKADIITYHNKRGLQLNTVETSADLTQRMLPGILEKSGMLFTHDCLAQFRVGS